MMGYELKPSDVYDLARVLDADVHEKAGSFSSPTAHTAEVGKQG